MKKLLPIFVLSVFFIGCYKPITLDFNNLNMDGKTMEQLAVLSDLERGGDHFLMLCMADYEKKKMFVSGKSPLGIYYKSTSQGYDIIVDSEAFFNLLK